MNTPPRLLLSFLHWYCKPELLEEIEGDIFELYQLRKEIKGSFFANIAAFWDIIRFFRRSNIRMVKTQYTGIMTRNYLKTGWRNLANNPAISFINISGLMLGIGCMITVFIFQDYFLNMDNFHTRRDNIYQVLNHVSGDGETNTWSDISMPVYNLLSGSGEIERITRIEFCEANIRYDKDVFREFVWAVDPDYLRMFDFPLQYGDRDVLDDKYSIVIAQPVAQKYFGDLDPMGKVLQLKFNDSTMFSFTVAAVMEKIPDRASFGGFILISSEVLNDIYGNISSDWNYLTDAIFIELNSGANKAQIEKMLSEGIELQNKSSGTWKTRTYELAALSDLPNRGTEIQGAISGGSNPAGRIALTVVGLLLLILACINYMNIAVASSARRLREIALRKVLGGVRSQIVTQFMFENLIICLIALAGGILLSYFVLLPGFNKMLPVTIPFEFSDVFLAFGFFILLILFVALFSGAYPSFYISRFRPVSIFRGKEKFGSSGLFSRILMTLQLFISFTTIVACFVFNDNALRLAERDWGYDESDVISIPVNSRTQLDYLANKATSVSSVSSVSVSNGHIGRRNPLTQISRGELTSQAFVYKVEASYQQTMGLRLKMGSWFDQGSSPGDNTVVINEETARRLDMNAPLEEEITYEGSVYRVIGVLEDFNEEIFYMDIMPAIFVQSEKEGMQFVTIRALPGKADEVYQIMAGHWKEVAPDDPYEAFYQEEVMVEFFRENKSNVVILTAISFISLFLASLGLYGLVSFQVQRRLKELSIRKVLGASLRDISRTINRSYLWMLSISFLLGLPVGYYLIHQLIIQIYPDPEPVTVRPFLIAVTVVLVAVVLTLGSQLFRISRNNPVDMLRTE